MALCVKLEPPSTYLEATLIGLVLTVLCVLRDVIPAFNMFALILKRAKVAGSPIGSPDEIREMLDLYQKKKTKGWIQTRKFEDTNKAVVDMDNGKARYRYVLVNEKQGGKL